MRKAGRFFLSQSRCRILEFTALGLAWLSLDSPAQADATTSATPSTHRTRITQIATASGLSVKTGDDPSKARTAAADTDIEDLTLASGPTQASFAAADRTETMVWEPPVPPAWEAALAGAFLAAAYDRPEASSAEANKSGSSATAKPAAAPPISTTSPAKTEAAAGGVSPVVPLTTERPSGSRLERWRRSSPILDAIVTLTQRRRLAAVAPEVSGPAAAPTPVELNLAAHVVSPVAKPAQSAEPVPELARIPTDVGRSGAVPTGDVSTPPGGVQPTAMVVRPDPAPPEAGLRRPEVAGGPVSAVEPVETGLVRDACASCGSSVRVRRTTVFGGSPASCASCGAGRAPCVPGQGSCADYDPDSFFGRFFGGFYECLCCPDPCYEPKWIAAADAAFFMDAARPQSQQRYRWAANLGMALPDRSEFFWARADGNGKGPSPVAPALGERRLGYHELSMYTEASTGSASAFVEMPYRSLNPDLAPQGVGFADMNIGTKALLFDCELLQVTFQFRTYMPSGNFRKGLGTGHVSLEPSLLMTLKLDTDCYLQSQISEWIPLGGDPDYAGAILHYHLSVNKVLYRITDDIQVIGSSEWHGWSFQDGLYTDPVLGPMKSSGETYLSAGPGLRIVVCDKIDFGVGAIFSLNNPQFAEQRYHSEFRWRY